MGRLIDADALIETLKNPPVHCSLGGITMNDIFTMVNEQSTAYSVEKVVAELESVENYYYDDALDAECNLISFKAIRQDVAIDIVRKGGVE